MRLIDVEVIMEGFAIEGRVTDKPRTDRQAVGVFALQAVPQQGETVVVFESSVRVLEVRHHIARGAIVVRVAYEERLELWLEEHGPQRTDSLSDSKPTPPPLVERGRLG